MLAEVVAEMVVEVGYDSVCVCCCEVEEMYCGWVGKYESVCLRVFVCVGGCMYIYVCVRMYVWECMCVNV